MRTTPSKYVAAPARICTVAFKPRRHENAWGTRDTLSLFTMRVSATVDNSRIGGRLTYSQEQQHAF